MERIIEKFKYIEKINNDWYNIVLEDRRKIKISSDWIKKNKEKIEGIELREITF